MKKTILAVMMAALSSSAFAGDYLTNTNQSVQFLRNPARDAAIGIDGVYSNPAGVSFLNDGWHLQFNWRMPHQHRDSKTSYGALFGANYLNPAKAEDGYSRTYTGRVSVPFLPSLFLAYNKNDWSFQAGFAAIGGGGKCKFQNGVGSFEALVGQMGMQTLGAAFGGYSLNSNLIGSSYLISGTLAAARKINDKLSVSVGIRGIYSLGQYEAYIRDITFRSNGANGMAPGTVIPVPTAYEIDCEQTGFGVAPIIGIDYKPNEYVNFAAKYEFKTCISPETKAHNNADFNALAPTQPAFAGFVDGAKTRNDVPGYLAIGTQISPIKQLRLCLGYHHYFDADTKQWIKDNVEDTDEFTFGVEYDINKYIEVSGGYQKTMYNQSPNNLSDTSFNVNSYSLGAGIGVNVSEKVKINLAYFQTNYDDYTKVTAQNKTVFSRKNKVLGASIDINF